ncbi:MAG: DUF3320 domain-containing protein [Alphaproteobacteria bacterium]|nr:DUF3320 domain-containing protein [Alphaproteobacteria bacterium]
MNAKENGDNCLAEHVSEATEANGKRKKRITWALEQARRDLVDATRRNRLLHAPLIGKRPWCLAVTGHTADDLLHRLYWDEGANAYAFQGVDEQPELKTTLFDKTNLPVALTPDSSPKSTGKALATRSRLASSRYALLQTRLAQTKLEKRLTKIFREERTLEEEQGLSTLYLAAGFLKWFDSDSSDEASYAPLILIPVSLTRVAGREGYVLHGRDDDIMVNVALREKLRGDFGLTVPDIPETEGWKPSDYFAMIEAEVSRQRRWQVERDSIGLGFFTFSKFMMWRDLDANSWPNGSLLDHGLLNVLLGESTSFANEPPIVEDDEPIDQRIDISKCVHVVDADSSQTVVIEEARGGRNLVVQGPPGTGKSQTITNVIAAAVHAGKSVLFVAEKTAALEVVHDRLRRAGLGALCLETHSRKANKREVLKSLEDALRLSGASRFDGGVVPKLAGLRDKLNSYTAKLHRPIGSSERSAYEVMGRQLVLRGKRTTLLDERLDFTAEWPAAKLENAELAIDRAATAVQRIGQTPSDHAWFGTGIAALSPFDHDRLRSSLSSTLEKVNALAGRLTGSLLQLVETEAPTLADARRVEQALRLVAQAPADRALLDNPAWQANLEQIEARMSRAENFCCLAADMEKRFAPEAWRYDTTNGLLALKADGGSFFRRLSARHRTVVADLRALSKDTPPKKQADRIAALESLQDAQTAKKEFEGIAGEMRLLLGDLWAECGTPWERVHRLRDWVRQARAMTPNAPLLRLAARSANLDTLLQYADQLTAIGNDAASALASTVADTKANLLVVFRQQQLEDIPLAALLAKLQQWQANLDRANDWVMVRDALNAVQQEGLPTIAARLEAGRLQPSEVRPSVDLLIAEALWRKASASDPVLSQIDGQTRSEEVDQFREFDRRRIQIARQEVLARYLDQKPSGYGGEMGIIRGEIDKKRSHRAVRKLMMDAGNAVQKLKPIFLMSPLSVAQFLPPGKLTFDVLVMDEASQIAPEEALGAVARAKQIVVVGDHKQLPPTNFFKAANAGADENEEDDTDVADVTRPSDYESILTLARTRGMAERMLAWHYRSKHPSLIALSNAECYADKLLLPPSPFVKTEQFGLTLETTPRGFYDRGGTSRDLVQAEILAKAVAQHMRKTPNKSLGIACLSSQQRDAVDDMIDKLGIRSDVEAFLPKGERLFVKNLEAIQGDERDVVFISIGYGVAPNQSKPFLNFGPVSKEGGERRLNVLASRARERCVVFSSITAADIPADHELRGTRMLRALLHYAETGNLSAGSLTGEGFDSPFEEAVAQVIREAGYHVHSQVGVSSFKVDLGVIDPARPGVYVLGVECDGATYHSSRSARDRDRLRQEVLEGLGWRLHRIWSTDWFRNPERETGKLIAAIQEAVSRHASPQLNLPEPEDDAAEDQGGDAPELILDPPLSHTRLPNVKTYIETSLSVPVGRDLLELRQHEMGRLIQQVIESEGPVHTEEVARRIREAFGLQKTGRRILEHVRNALLAQSRSGGIERYEEFWQVAGREVTAIRDRRTSALPLRKASMISPQEYQLALKTALKEAVAMPREELIIQAARLFGFDRTGPELKTAVDTYLDALVRKGEIAEDGDKLVLVGSSV